MDGGRRVLRSLTEWFAPLLAPSYAHAAPASRIGYNSVLTADPDAAPLGRLRTLKTAPHAASNRLFGYPRLSGVCRLLARPGVGFLFVVALFGAVGAAAFVQNGEYDRMARREGSLRDIAARMLGFPIDAITITGQSQLKEDEILKASGVGPANSLLFLDVGAVRERVLTLPMVKSARVLKLYPNRLVIGIEERQPFALWQLDGRLSVVASDGTVIDEMRDERFASLPFVVGDGAQKRLPEYAGLIAAAGDLGPRIKAGVLISGRRWTLDMTNGVSVKLPDQDPQGALATLARLQRETHILDKDILWIDLRSPGKVAVRLTEEGLATRAAATPNAARKAQKGGH
jgi:cell division protein FtsQ